jgi:ribosomal protein L21
MIVYSTVDYYLQHQKPNDIIVLGGKGILNGLNYIENVHDTLKVHNDTTSDKLVVRHYKGRKNYTLNKNNYNQEVAVLSADEFKQLKR